MGDSPELWGPDMQSASGDPRLSPVLGSSLVGLGRLIFKLIRKYLPSFPAARIPTDLSMEHMTTHSVV